MTCLAACHFVALVVSDWREACDSPSSLRMQLLPEYEIDALLVGLVDALAELHRSVGKATWADVYCTAARSSGRGSTSPRADAKQARRRMFVHSRAAGSRRPVPRGRSYRHLFVSPTGRECFLPGGPGAVPHAANVCIGHTEGTGLWIGPRTLLNLRCSGDSAGVPDGKVHCLSVAYVGCGIGGEL